MLSPPTEESAVKYLLKQCFLKPWVAKAMRVGREGLQLIARKRKRSVRTRFEK